MRGTPQGCRSMWEGSASGPPSARSARRSPVPHGERCIAGLAPKMLALSAERSRGTHPYFVPPSHAEAARAVVGPDALIAPEVACVVDADDDRARDVARAYARTYLRLRNY